MPALPPELPVERRNEFRGTLSAEERDLTLREPYSTPSEQALSKKGQVEVPEFRHPFSDIYYRLTQLEKRVATLEQNQTDASTPSAHHIAASGPVGVKPINSYRS